MCVCERRSSATTENKRRRKEKEKEKRHDKRQMTGTHSPRTSQEHKSLQTSNTESRRVNATRRKNKTGADNKNAEK
jgi:hypothetical protein